MQPRVAGDSRACEEDGETGITVMGDIAVSHWMAKCQGRITPGLEASLACSGTHPYSAETW